MTRLSYGVVMAASVSLLGVASIASFAPRLIWNASASTPVGFYTIGEVGNLEVTDLVAVDAPEPLATFLSDGGYLPRGVPLLKRVAALPGQRVCRTGLVITVDGVPMGDALDRDRRGRLLPIWRGCQLVANGELFLMNWQVRDSLDGRYFGPLPATAVIGRATPLYTDEDGDGRFVWRAPTR
ncbi:MULTISPECIES: S26 family signal peptidase [Alphaproteobacteria]|jgi:conjugative transfer signal peptidase TraF|uniref:S26 family signal peptidase n=2 Tax=Pseudomonadota TaxID=1224 RepID=A0A256GUN1_9HYPH|nr:MULTISPECIES: S26 family signal peptidase [Pseudomonadota]MCS9837952.1 S26 family signal peptidase [Pseudomonas aeruginosa]OWJ70312.1 S26 family signal peptidase [Haematobacter massiliensis]QOD64895.1 S26 family signal peptidase [Ochrobactrum sp. MT180101]KAB2701393.1 S26 family signal peptidase [Brucella lupini]MCR8490297.1 S26 family signal peptidase [Brucella anthropi]